MARPSIRNNQIRLKGRRPPSLFSRRKDPWHIVAYIISFPWRAFYAVRSFLFPHPHSFRKGGEHVKIVLITAFGVGGATVLGSLIGFLAKRIPPRFSNALLCFAAGVMLSAAISGLIEPAVECAGKNAVILVTGGIFAGALFLNLLGRFTPWFHRIAGISPDISADSTLLFVAAIAIHNLPEGIAAGVSFGTGSIGDALRIAGGIALQNIPEGMVIIAPMQNIGIRPGRTFLIAFATGVSEIIGTLIGYYFATVSAAVLPFALAFAGGTMLYVITDEMIPNNRSTADAPGAGYALLSGFCLMIAMNQLMG